MEFIGKIESISYNLSGGVQVTLTANIKAEKLIELKDVELDVKLSKYRKKRSLSANSLMWIYLQKMAEVLQSDKWSIYLQMLRKYGQFTYVVVKPQAVEEFVKNWRECEVLGEIEVNGNKGVQILCYFGSSTYNTKDFSFLLNGIIEECKEIGIDTISDEEFERLMKDYEESHKAKAV
jgi:hypothetical protein